MRRINFGATILGTVAALVIATASGDARSEVKPYQGILPDQAEFISTPASIISVASSGAPMQNAQNREIAAWWLRRRIIGVFGPGEVYQQTLATLASDSNATKRAYAASAIGEFLLSQGISPVATALTHDASALVRSYAAKALGRLNDEGAGALGAAMGDSDSGVRVAALTAAGRINSFTDAVAVTKDLSDADALVRPRAVMLLDDMHAVDSAAAVLVLAKSDSDVDVRIAACHALGTFGDTSAFNALTAIATNDSSSLVRDMAQIALRQL
jgi:HEAT repeat protein